VIDPRQYFAAQAAAYNLPNLPARLTVIDVLTACDIDGSTVPYAIVVKEADGTIRLVFHGTRDWQEIVADIDAVPDGDCSAGVAGRFKTLAAQSGAALSTYAGAKVGGHSLGADLAVKWIQAYGASEYCLFAYPCLCEQAVLDALTPIPGIICEVRGDPIAMLVTGYSRPSNVTRFKAPRFDLDPLYYHELTTYEAAIGAAAA
jgi:hypothetical protein